MMRTAAWIAVATKSSAATSTKPNFVYILMDDFWLLGGDAKAMPQTTKLVRDEGASFDNFFVSSPKCTPSRSSWLTGRYYHNLRPHGATSGRGLNTSSFADVDALFPRLHAAGYATALFGKLHNDQRHWLCHGTSPLTASFTHIEAECSPCGGYYANAWSRKDNATDMVRTFTLPSAAYGRAYSHAEYGNRTIAWLRQVAGSQPFFAYVGTTGPHLNAVPAPWHRDATSSLRVRAPRTPNFNQHAPNHNPLLARAPALDGAAVESIDQLMRNRWGTLLSIDDLISGVVHALGDLRVLESTYVLVSSDHGYHLGQFRIPDEKMLPYESDVRVPLWIRGPQISPGSKPAELAMNIDVAPTLLELAGEMPPITMDGRSLVPLLCGGRAAGGERRGGVWRTALLSEFAEGGTQVWAENGLWLHSYSTPEDISCGVSCGAKCPSHPPPRPAAGGPQYIYDTPQNQWRMLRVINATDDFAFIQWDEQFVFANVSFVEFFDLRRDPWQQTNAWSALSDERRAALTAKMERLYACKGAAACSAEENVR